MKITFERSAPAFWNMVVARDCCVELPTTT